MRISVCLYVCVCIYVHVSSHNNKVLAVSRIESKYLFKTMNNTVSSRLSVFHHMGLTNEISHI